MVTTETRPINEEKLMAFLHRVVGDVGATVGLANARIGDRLGLYEAMADGAPVDSAELAARTGTVERYVREWLINQAAGGYVDYDPATGKYSMPYEHALALGDPGGPFAMGGAFQLILSAVKAEPRVAEAFRTGGGVLWGDHDAELFEGTERFFRPGYMRDLVANWIPALDGVRAKLEAGATVADVGCGHGASTILLAQAFPNSRFYGSDNHAPSIAEAIRAAREAGVDDRVSFEVCEGSAVADRRYDLVAYFDCVHDMGDPLGALRRAAATLKDDGTIMCVEPAGGERVEENFNPVGRVYSGASVLVCTSNALAAGGPGLGTIVPDSRLRSLFSEAGFSRFRRATETPFNRVFEARK